MNLFLIHLFTMSRLLINRESSKPKFIKMTKSKFLEDSGIDPTDERLQGQTSPVKRSDSVTERPRSQVRKNKKKCG